MSEKNKKRSAGQFGIGVKDKASGRGDFIVLDSRLRGNDSLRQRGFHYLWMLKRVQHDKVEETGRSMVEMLGVLAIIGVLSAGAIGGYHYAMNKYRTNELIYEATKRAQWVWTQLEMRNTNPNLLGFGSGELGGGTFTGSVLTLPDNQIGIVVENLKESVCEEIKDTIGDNTVVRAIKDSAGTGDITCADNITAALIFNQDLSTDVMENHLNENGADDETNALSTEAETTVTTTIIPDCDEILVINDHDYCYITSGGPFDWIAARQACGGYNNMVTLNDLNCVTNGPMGECDLEDLSSDANFWLADCYETTCSDSVSNLSEWIGGWNVQNGRLEGGRGIHGGDGLFNALCKW